MLQLKREYWLHGSPVRIEELKGKGWRYYRVRVAQFLDTALSYRVARKRAESLSRKALVVK